jgi:hypothetical protein
MFFHRKVSGKNIRLAIYFQATYIYTNTSIILTRFKYTNDCSTPYSTMTMNRCCEIR